MKTFIDKFGVTYSEDRKTLIKGNPELEEYVVMSGVEIIGEDAWGTMQELKRIVLPDGLKEIKKLAFSGCIGLVDLRIPKTVTEIGSYTFEFTMLRQVVVPEGVKVIRNDVFGGCVALSFLVLPNTIERIEDYAFCSCHGTQIWMLSEKRTLSFISETAFDQVNLVLVPYDLQREYMEAFPQCDAVFLGLKHSNNTLEVISPNGDVAGELNGIYAYETLYGHASEKS